MRKVIIVESDLDDEYELIFFDFDEVMFLKMMVEN